MRAATGWNYAVDVAHLATTTYPHIKRIVDVVVVILLLFWLLPLFIICAVAVKLSSPGTIFFRQTRIGEHGKPFTMLKFRSMYSTVDSVPHYEYAVAYVRGTAQKLEHNGSTLYKLGADERITPTGQWLRQTSLDELPQLLNILRGDMSLVGPRPPLAYEIEHYLPHHFRRMAVRPGLTGLWQVSGRGRTTFEEMVALDCDYIRRQSLALDLQILLRTIPAVIHGSGAR